MLVNLCQIFYAKKMNKCSLSNLVNPDWVKVRKSFLYILLEKIDSDYKNIIDPVYKDVYMKVQVISLLKHFRGFAYLMEDRREIT